MAGRDYDDDYDEDIEDLEDADADEEDDLSDYKPETVEAAKKRTAALDNGWTIGGIAQLIEYTPTLATAIEEGVFDGPEIKAIITACMNRRAVVLGKPMPNGKSSAGRSPRASGRAKVNLAINQDKGTTRYHGPILGEAGVLLNTISGPTAPRDIFNAGGKRYAKSDMLGKVVRLPSNFSTWYLGNQLVKIRDVRLKGIEVELVENPEYIHPDSYELKKAKFRPGYAFDITALDIEHIFG